MYKVAQVTTRASLRAMVHTARHCLVVFWFLDCWLSGHAYLRHPYTQQWVWRCLLDGCMWYLLWLRRVLLKNLLLGYSKCIYNHWRLLIKLLLVRKVLLFDNLFWDWFLWSFTCLLLFDLSLKFIFDLSRFLLNFGYQRILDTREKEVFRLFVKFLLFVCADKRIYFT